MQIYYDLQRRVRGSCPVYCRVEVVRRTLDVWRTAVIICPVADWYANKIEAGRCDLLEFVEGDPTIPVVPQDSTCLVGKLLCQCKLVDNPQRLVYALED
jgi:hypothetical protein